MKITKREYDALPDARKGDYLALAVEDGGDQMYLLDPDSPLAKVFATQSSGKSTALSVEENTQEEDESEKGKSAAASLKDVISGAAVRKTNEHCDPSIGLGVLVKSQHILGTEGKTGAKLSAAIEYVSQGKESDLYRNVSLMESRKTLSVDISDMPMSNTIVSSHGEALFGDPNPTQATRGRYGGILIPPPVSQQMLDLRTPKLAYSRVINGNVSQGKDGIYKYDRRTSLPVATFVPREGGQPVIDSSTVKPEEHEMSRIALTMMATWRSLRDTSITSIRELTTLIEESIARNADLALLFADGTVPHEPRGILGGATEIPATAYVPTDPWETNYSIIRTDLLTVMNAMASALSEMKDPVCLMSTSLKNALALMGSAQSTQPFADGIYKDVPEISGFRIVDTTNIPTTLGGGGDETYVWFGDSKDLLGLTDPTMSTFAVDSQGAIQLQNGQTISLVQTEQSAVHVWNGVGTVTLHGNTSYKLTGVKWHNAV